MIVIAGFILGALWGGFLARRRKGRTLDILQYATAFAILGAILGLFATVFIDRLA
ncbi:hypothetical protein [Ostreiculturibacter nitratireducens]|uniref:hypothetical protein n=1 Tax=Ostreiculturibacter nitratireducens TaxID=3075226 RepID=UPI0031B5EC72